MLKSPASCVHLARLVLSEYISKRIVPALPAGADDRWLATAPDCDELIADVPVDSASAVDGAALVAKAVLVAAGTVLVAIVLAAPVVPAAAPQAARSDADYRNPAPPAPRRSERREQKSRYGLGKVPSLTSGPAQHGWFTVRHGQRRIGKTLQQRD